LYYSFIFYYLFQNHVKKCSFYAILGVLEVQNYKFTKKMADKKAGGNADKKCPANSYRTLTPDGNLNCADLHVSACAVTTHQMRGYFIQSRFQAPLWERIT